MYHILIFSVPYTNENLPSYGEHELLHEGEESNLRLAFKLISYECERNEIDTAHVSLQGFRTQEQHKCIPYGMRVALCPTHAMGDSLPRIEATLMGHDV